MVEKSTNHDYGTDYFTANPSISITPPVLMRLQHLPMPERSTIKELVEIGHQAWLNGAKSVRLGITTGKPRVFWANPYPYPSKPACGGTGYRGFVGFSTRAWVW